MVNLRRAIYRIKLLTFHPTPHHNLFERRTCHFYKNLATENAAMKGTTFMYTEYMICKYTLHLCQLETNNECISCDDLKQFLT
jgi:hypothetical protein